MARYPSISTHGLIGDLQTAALTPALETRSPSPPTSATAAHSTGRSPTSRSATPTRTNKTSSSSSRQSGLDG